MKDLTQLTYWQVARIRDESLSKMENPNLAKSTRKKYEKRYRDACAELAERVGGGGKLYRRNQDGSYSA